MLNNISEGFLTSLSPQIAQSVAYFSVLKTL